MTSIPLMILHIVIESACIFKDILEISLAIEDLRTCDARVTLSFISSWIRIIQRTEKSINTKYFFRKKFFLSIFTKRKIILFVFIKIDHASICNLSKMELNETQTSNSIKTILSKNINLLNLDNIKKRGTFFLNIFLRRLSSCDSEINSFKAQSLKSWK